MVKQINADIFHVSTKPRHSDQDGTEISKALKDKESINYVLLSSVCIPISTVKGGEKI